MLRPCQGTGLRVQSLVWKKLGELRGDSAIFALANWVQEELSDELSNYLSQKSLSQVTEDGLGAMLALEARTLWPASSVDFQGEVAGAAGAKNEGSKEEGAGAGVKNNPTRGNKKLKGGGPFWRRQRGSALQRPPPRSGREQRLRQVRV